MAKDIEELERVITAYQGGKLRAGDVPIGAALLPAELQLELVKSFAAKGFGVSYSAHKDEEALLVITVWPRLAPASEQVSEPEPAVAELPKEG